MCGSSEKSVPAFFFSKALVQNRYRQGLVKMPQTRYFVAEIIQSMLFKSGQTHVHMYIPRPFKLY